MMGIKYEEGGGNGDLAVDYPQVVEIFSCG